MTTPDFGVLARGHKLSRFLRGCGDVAAKLDTGELSDAARAATSAGTLGGWVGGLGRSPTRYTAVGCTVTWLAHVVVHAYRVCGIGGWCCWVWWILLGRWVAPTTSL
jgi:hypothetical protein